jgi:hypothetical protein
VIDREYIVNVNQGLSSASISLDVLPHARDRINWRYFALWLISTPQRCATSLNSPTRSGDGVTLAMLTHSL